MTIRTLKTVMLISALATAAVLFLAFLAAPLVGSAYLQLAVPRGTDLSRLTTDFSLPMLRVAPPPGEPPAWPILVWIVLVAFPPALWLWNFGCASVELCLARWLTFIYLYMAILACLFIAVFSGLLLSIVPM